MLMVVHLLTSCRLGPDVKKRVKALKNIQVKHASLSLEFEKEIAALELKYAGLHGPLYEQARRI